MASVKTIVAAGASMSQSSVMGAALVAGFVVFLMMKGKLSAYWSILMGGSASTSPTSSSSGSTSTKPSTPGLPGLSANPFAGLPTSICQFLGNCAPTSVAPPAATPSTGTGGH